MGEWSGMQSEEKGWHRERSGDSGTMPSVGWESFRELATEISGEGNREPLRLPATEGHQASWILE